MDNKAAIKSPCISVCTVDGLSGYCLGCYRTLKEISNWWVMDDDSRDTVMAERDNREQIAKDKRAAWAARQKAAQKAS